MDRVGRGPWCTSADGWRNCSILTFDLNSHLIPISIYGGICESLPAKFAKYCDQIMSICSGFACSRNALAALNVLYIVSIIPGGFNGAPHIIAQWLSQSCSWMPGIWGKLDGVINRHTHTVTESDNISDMCWCGTTDSWVLVLVLYGNGVRRCRRSRYRPPSTWHAA